MSAIMLSMLVTEPERAELRRLVDREYLTAQRAVIDLERLKHDRPKADISAPWSAAKKRTALYADLVHALDHAHHPMADLQTMVGEWQAQTFGKHNNQDQRVRLDAIVAHLRREVAELAGEDGKPPHSPEEAADCAILLLGHAARGGYSLHDAIVAKFAALRARQWGKPDADDVIEHVRESK